MTLMRRLEAIARGPHGLLILASLIGFVAFPLGLRGWQLYQDRFVPVPTVTPAGKLLDAQYIESSDSIKSRVNTTEGVFLVDRPVTGWKGRPLIVLTKSDGSSWLCDEAQTTCHRIFR